MEYRRLGKSGLKVSALSFGSWVTFKNQVDETGAAECMQVAYDAGVNFFDNAEVYAQGESEIIMGKALKRLKWSRDTYCVSSKVFWGGEKPTQRGLSRKHVVDACHAALNRLQVDYLDLFFCHRPDSETPIEETVAVMNDLIAQGKVLYWGTSEWSADEIMQAYAVSRQYGFQPPTMEQPQYSMLQRHRFEHEYARLYREIGLGTTIWSPLASGLLTGKYNDGVPAGSRLSMAQFGWLKERVLDSPEGQKNAAIVKNLSSFATEIDVPMPQLAIGWCLKNPNVSTVILGASKVEQLRQNLAAIDVVAKLTDEVMARIEDILGNKPDPWPSY